MTTIKEVEQITKNPTNFELILSELHDIDEKRLEALVSLREKLKFNSENPKLIISNSRQVAVGTLLEISGSISGTAKRQKIDATVHLNTPNFIYIDISTSTERKIFEKFSSLSVKFRPLRQKMVYQFDTDSQDTGANALLSILHSDAVKIIEEL